MYSITRFEKQKRVFLTIILSFYLFSSYAAKWSHELTLNNSSFSVPKIAITQGKFYAVIDHKGECMRIVPEGKPVITKESVVTPLGEATREKYHWGIGRPYELICYFTQVNDEVFSLRGCLVNQSTDSIYLQKIVLLDGLFEVSGKADEWMLSTTDIEARRTGTLDRRLPSELELASEKAYSRSYFIRRGLQKQAEDPFSRCYLNDASLYQEGSQQGITLAAVDTISDVYFEMKIDDVRIQMEVESDMSEVLLEPGESRISDEVLFIAKPWGEAQQIRNKWIAQICNVSLNTTPVYGWCSWYRAGLRVTPDDIRNISDYVYQQRDRLPFDVVQIDDGWQVFRGNWNENKKFTGQLSHLAQTIKEYGMMPGIWLSPGRCDMITGVCGEKERPFPMSCYVNYKVNHPSEDRLDPIHPQVSEFILKSLRQHRDNGYRYFKLDFSQIPFGAKRFYDSKKTRFQAQRELFRLYREGIGEDSYLLACGISDQRSMLPYIDADRIGTDCTPGKGFARSMASDNLPKDIHGLLYPILSMSNKCYENGILCHGDPDVTYTGFTGATRPKQLQTFHSFVGIYAGLALTSDKLYQNEYRSDDHIRMMEILYPITKEKGVSYTGGWDIYGQEFGYTVKRSWGNAINVIVWNPDSKHKKDLGIKHIPVKELGTKFHVWSFWDESYKGISDINYTASQVLPYEHELLRLTPVTDVPTVIGSNLHISMGTAEIKNIVSDKMGITIELFPEAGARSGRIYLYSKKPLNEVHSTNSKVQLFKKSENLYVLVLENRDRNEREIISVKVSNQEPLLYENALLQEDIYETISKSGFSEEWGSSW